jgi:hypothetical protein
VGSFKAQGLMTLLCERIIVVKSGWCDSQELTNLPHSSKEGRFSKKAVLPMMMWELHLCCHVNHDSTYVFEICFYLCVRGSGLDAISEFQGMHL